MVRSSLAKVSNTRPRVNLSMRPTAFKMSSTRSRQSLGGTDRLRKDTVAELAAQAVGRRQIDSDAQDLFEPVLHTEQVKVPDRLGELGDEVNVAVRTCLVTCNGPEDGERTNK